MNLKNKRKEQYESYVRKHGLSLFYQPWYLDAVCGSPNWDVVIASRDHKDVGVWPYYMKKKNGLSTITQPILTSYLGPHILKQFQTNKVSTQLGFEKKVLTELVNQLPSVSRLVVQGHPHWINWQPLSWLGFEQTTRYTYHIDLTQDIKTLRHSLSDKTRNQIKIATEEITIEETNNYNEIFDLVEPTYKRQGSPMPFTKQQFETLHSVLNDYSSHMTYVAVHAKEKVAVVYNAYHNGTAYLLLTGQSDKKIKGSVTILIWKSIIEAKERGCTTFDFEGSMLEGVESFFRSFGGEQVAYHRVSKASNKPLYLLFKLFGKI